jgi:hypothetical protein
MSSEQSIQRMRQLALAVTAVVVFDMVWVRAPFGAIIALPFAITAWRLRTARIPTRLALIAACALYVAIGVSYAMSNGIHDGAGHNASALINPGDFAFAYLGTPLAALLALQVVLYSLQGRRTRSAAAVV